MTTVIAEVAAKTAGELILEKVLLPAVKILPGSTAVLSYVGVYRGLFRLPKGKIRLVYPLHTTPHTGEHSVSLNDQAALNEVQRMLRLTGQAEGKRCVADGIDVPLDDEARKDHLVILCGSNAMWTELEREHGGLLSNVTYRHSIHREERRFEWNNHEYRWTKNTDYAVLAIRPNPYATDRRLVLLMGLRDIGTRGAARVFASRSYRELRKELMRRASDGALEVLLRVAHSDDRKIITGVTIAQPDDGVPIAGAWHPAHSEKERLAKIYVSLEQTPRPIQLSDFEYELTYAANYSLRFQYKFSWAAGEADVIVQGAHLEAEPALADGEDVGFTAVVLKGEGTELVSVCATDTPTRKEYLLFPLPPILTGEGPRRYQLDATWPRAGDKLAHVNQPELATCHVFNHSKDPVNRVTFRIKFEIPGARFLVTPKFPTNGRIPRPGIVCHSEHDFEYSETNVQPGREFVVNILRR